MLHHQQTVKFSSFITLTYRDENLMIRHGVANLVKSDAQKYFKRLRINELRLDRRPLIQYYLCGEYGDRTSRPHMHFILFGDIDVFSYPIEKRGRRIFAVAGNPVFDAWELGEVNVGYAEADSIRYVAQYIDKKILGSAAPYDHREAPFQLASQSLGRDWAESNVEKMLYDAALVFRGKKFPIPKYYRDIIYKSFPAAANGLSDRLIRESIIADLDTIAEMMPEVAGICWEDMDDTMRSEMTSKLIERNKAFSEVKRLEIKFKSRSNDL